jgi:hypothetical protein
MVRWRRVAKVRCRRGRPGREHHLPSAIDDAATVALIWLASQVAASVEHGAVVVAHRAVETLQAAASVEGR